MKETKKDQRKSSGKTTTASNKMAIKAILSKITLSESGLSTPIKIQRLTG